MSPDPAGIPGELLAAQGVIVLNAERSSVQLIVENSGDRPIQVGSHYAFAHTNPALRFDRGAAAGMRLDIPAGTSVRFEPGVSQQVTLVALGGAQTVPGLRTGFATPGSVDG